MRLDFCVACACHDNLNHHHLFPRVHGGSDDDVNLITLCRECHGRIHNADWSADHVELVKAGMAKVRERSAADWREIARQKRREAARAAEKAATIAREAEQAEAEAAVKEKAAELPALTLVASNSAKRASDLPTPSLSVIASDKPASKPIASPKPAPQPREASNDVYYSREIKQMQKDRRFRVVGGWALASDGAQWVLQRSAGKHWVALSFVHTTKDILARCVQEAGVPDDTAEQLLAGLPADFDAWHERFDPAGYLPSGQSEKIVMTALETPFNAADPPRADDAGDLPLAA